MSGNDRYQEKDRPSKKTTITLVNADDLPEFSREDLNAIIKAPEDIEAVLPESHLTEFCQKRGAYPIELVKKAFMMYLCGRYSNSKICETLNISEHVLRTFITRGRWVKKKAELSEFYDKEIIRYYRKILKFESFKSLLQSMKVLAKVSERLRSMVESEGEVSLDDLLKISETLDHNSLTFQRILAPLKDKGRGDHY